MSLLDQAAAALQGGGTAGPDVDYAVTLQTWTQARDLVNGQLGKLQAQLRATGDPDFARIADAGLNGITKRLQVGLQVALLELINAKGEESIKTQARARKALAEFQSFLDTDPMVAVLDDQPFDVTLTLRTTLGKALNTIAAALSR